MVSALIVKLGEVYVKDVDLQAQIKEMVLANEAMSSGMHLPQEGETTTPAEYKDPILEMVESAKNSLNDEGQPLFDLVAYENEDSTYFDLVSLSNDASQPFNVQVHVSAKDTTTNVDVKCLLAGYKYPAEGETPEPTDWVALEESILSGTDPSATMVKVAVNSVDETDSKNKTELTINLASAGISAGITLSTAANLETMESNSEFALSMMMPDPLLKVSVHTAPTDEQPVAPVVEGMKEVVLGEEISEEDQALLSEAAGSIGSILIEKLSAILPEEAPAILQMIQGSMAGAGDSAMPEPSVEGEGK